MQRTIRGIEKKPLPHSLSLTNLILHGIDVPDIQRDNALTRQPLSSYTEKDRVDCILTNPPFGGMEEPGVESNFPKAFQTKETADLFLVLIIKLLKNGGRAAIVLPDGSLFARASKPVSRSNSIQYVGMSAIYEGLPYEFIYPDLMMKMRAHASISTKYLHHALLSPLIRKYFRENASGTSGSMPKINQGTVVKTLIPLPPLNEQKRIVAKVETLLRLCDDLHAQLTHARQKRETLLHAVLHHALQ